MRDKGEHRGGLYESMDEYELLESLDSEGGSEARSLKSKISIIIGGLLLGGAAVLFFSEDYGKQAVAPPVKENSVPPKKSSKKAEPKKAKDPAAATAQEIKKPESVDERLAKLQQQNLIGEDIEAPGSIEESPPEKPITKSEPSPKPAAVATARAEITLQPAAAKTPPKPKPVKKAKPAPPATKSSYAVKVFATPNIARAQDYRDELEALGYKTRIIKTGKVRQSLYNVASESFNSVRSAARRAQHLANAGFQSRVEYTGKKRNVILSLGSFRNRDPAEKLAYRANKAGFRFRVTKRSEPQDLYLIRVGAYKTKSEAEKVVARLKRQGFGSIGVSRLSP